MKTLAIAAVALCVSSGVQARDAFRDRSCVALRNAVQATEPTRGAALILVTEEAPDGRALAHWKCAALPGGERLSPVKAEATR